MWVEPAWRSAEPGLDTAAADRETTYVLIGQPTPRGLGRFGGSLSERLMERLAGLAVRIVAGR